MTDDSFIWDTVRALLLMGAGLLCFLAGRESGRVELRELYARSVSAGEKFEVECRVVGCPKCARVRFKGRE